MDTAREHKDSWTYLNDKHLSASGKLSVTALEWVPVLCSVC